MTAQAKAANLAARIISYCNEKALTLDGLVAELSAGLPLDADRAKRLTTYCDQVKCLTLNGLVDETWELRNELAANVQAEEILAARHDQFTTTNTHDLREGDIIRTHGMVVRIGAKQISDQGPHADNGHGCAHYHLSEILAAESGMPQPGSRPWNVQGNRLAKWAKYAS